MTLLTLTLLVFTFVSEGISLMKDKNESECSYLKFSPNHSGCLPRNRKCRIYDATFSATEKELIVSIHNEYRSKVAMGKEKRGGGLPPAANMLEMEWDEELALIAQKWAEQCSPEHDCSECRSVDRFSKVGQNLLIMKSSKNFKMTRKARERRLKDAVKTLYDEIADYNKKWLQSHKPKRGDFIQIIWSKTFLIGCGNVYFREKDVDNYLLVCNYAPGGNRFGKRVYKIGKPCSECSALTCCGFQCLDYGSEAKYEGLCKKVEPPNLFLENDSKSTEHFSAYVWKKAT